MKFTSITAPFRTVSEALSPGLLANKLVEGGHRIGGAAGATIAGGVGVMGGGAAAIAIFEKLNPFDAARQLAADTAIAPTAGAKLGVILGGASEIAVDLIGPLIMLTFAFESIDATAQAWDKPQNRITLDK